MFIFNIFKRDNHFKEHKKQILEWYKLWRDWFEEVESLYDEDDGPIPFDPDELYPEMSDESVEKFGCLSLFERETIRRMAHVNLLKILGVKW